MTFFESLLALLAAAIVLTQVTRRISIPYPSALAAAGLAAAYIPGAPDIQFDPHMALALFIAPALVDAAFDFPLSAMKRLWRPLLFMAVVAVVVTSAAVAAIGVWAGLPLAAAITLGAIVAPPDAAAASAILASAALPRRSVEVLKGESLLNDSSALLLFAASTAVVANGGIDTGVAIQLGLAVPGGIVFGLAGALLYRRLGPLVAGSLGGNLLEFVNTFWIWIIAEKLHLSPVLAVVTFAMVLARSPEIVRRAEVRIHSYAVWGTVVFLLNVLAFLLMGMQARSIVSGMSHERLIHAGQVAGIVVAVVIAIRMTIVLLYNRAAARFGRYQDGEEPPTLAQGLAVGWCGMRGLVTLATAFALPGGFPQRDLVVLTAFAVVIATLVVQGLTLEPLIRLLKLNQASEHEDELADARRSLAEAGLAAIEGKTGKAADHVRHRLEMERDAVGDEAVSDKLDGWIAVQRKVMAAERARLIDLRDDRSIGQDAFEVLQQELDFRELSVRSGDETLMEEG